MVEFELGILVVDHPWRGSALMMVLLLFNERTSTSYWSCESTACTKSLPASMWKLGGGAEAVNPSTDLDERDSQPPH